MIKDYIKFRNAVKKDTNLSLEESYFLELIFDYHNISFGYAFPSYEKFMSDLKTNRRAKVSKLIKSLVKKGYIEVKKVNRHNTYKLLKYLFINDNKPRDSNGKPPLTGQVHFTELTPEETEVIQLANVTQNQAKRLLELSKNKLDKVIEYAEYALDKGVKNVYGYVKKLIEVNADVSQSTKKNISFVDNCSSRNYSEEFYQDIESRLLGWT